MFRRLMFLLVIASLMSGMFLATSQAAVPKILNYQGTLSDSSGKAVNSSVSMTFNIYKEETGGIALWTETQTVSVANGFYAVVLGNTNSIGLPFDTQYYLGVKVGTDTEMTPRNKLATLPYAFRAATADNLGITCKDGEVLSYQTATATWGCSTLSVGAQGLKGENGPQGIKGDTGLIGPQGLQGIIGLTGVTGPTGSQGAKGDTGAVGLQGAQGVKGDTGATGPTNSLAIGNVNTGNPGTVALANITGTAPNQTLNLLIPQGTQGAKGDTGTMGPQGIQGQKGDTGLTGTQGMKGDIGPQGATGPAGGAQGPPGPQGRVSNVSQELYDSVCELQHYIGSVARPSFCNKKIFITDTLKQGNIGTTADALTSADGICQTEANIAGLPGTYKAYISTSSINAKDRLTHSNDKYVLVDGSVIAINWDNLVSSKLLALLNKKADGTNVAGFLDAYWTGSTFGGIAYNGFTCNDWTDASYNYRGIFTKIEDQYLETPNSIYWSNSCAVPYRLVCIQQ